MIDTFTNTVIGQLKKDEELTIAGFGTFLSRIRYARGGVNPQNQANA